MASLPSTEEFLQLAWSELSRSNADRKHPFNYCTLATFGIYPEARTVVLRHFDKEEGFVIFTDSRTPKVKEIEKNDKVTLLFYHTRKKLQVRVRGKAAVHFDGVLHAKHMQQVLQNRKDYSTEKAPGSLLEANVHRTDELHFAVIQVTPVQMDILQLGKEEHQRALYHFKGAEVKGEWVVP